MRKIKKLENDIDLLLRRSENLMRRVSHLELEHEAEWILGFEKVAGEKHVILTCSRCGAEAKESKSRCPKCNREMVNWVFIQHKINWTDATSFTVGHGPEPR